MSNRYVVSAIDDCGDRFNKIGDFCVEADSLTEATDLAVTLPIRDGGLQVTLIPSSPLPPQDDEPTWPEADECACEFMPYDEPNDIGDSWHYKRRCYLCGNVFWSLHCRCEQPQRSCSCDRKPKCKPKAKLGPIAAKMQLHWGSEAENHVCSRPPLGLGYNAGEVVHQHEGGLWWFWDETWTDEFGGYCLKEQAEEAAKRYGESL